MKAQVKYGFLLAVAGLLVWSSGLPGDYTSLTYLSLGAVVVGGLMVYSAVQSWYCAACGQHLGRGEKPSKCGRCGSNRVTTEDPGAER